MYFQSRLVGRTTTNHHAKNKKTPVNNSESQTKFMCIATFVSLSLIWFTVFVGVCWSVCEPIHIYHGTFISLHCSLCLWECCIHVSMDAKMYIVRPSLLRLCYFAYITMRPERMNFYISTLKYWCVPFTDIRSVNSIREWRQIPNLLELMHDTPFRCKHRTLWWTWTNNQRRRRRRHKFTF